MNGSTSGERRTNRCDSSDTSGELRFDYLLWIKYDPKTGQPIEGKCVHPITSGTKDFADTRGVLTMHDAPPGHEKIHTYQGEIVLNAVANEPVTAGQDGTDRSVAPQARTARY
jgi:hypothetical protein